MRNRDASAGSSSVDPTRALTLPDTDVVAAAWSNRPPAGEFPPRPDKAKAFSGAMLAIGFALFLFVPLGGALFLVAGGLGLTISSEVQPSSATDQ
jgi:hypothetical protein